MNLAELLRNLQAVKKHQASKNFQVFAHRVDLLNQLLEKLPLGEEQKTRLGRGVARSRDDVESRGAILFVGSDRKDILLENFFRAVLEGSAAIFARTPNSKWVTGELETALVQTPELASGLMFVDEDEAQFLRDHPSVPVIHFAGERSSAEQYFTGLPVWAKQVETTIYGQSSYFSFDRITPSLIGRFLDLQDHSETPKRFFFLDKNESFSTDQMAQIFRSHSNPIDVSLPFRGVENILNQIKSEGGKFLTGGEPELKGDRTQLSPTLVTNLSNCSDLYQRHLPLPLAFLHTIKYPFDLQKWLDQSAAHHGLVIESDDSDRGNKFASAIRRSQLWMNRWINEDDSPLRGSNLSFGKRLR